MRPGFRPQIVPLQLGRQPCETTASPAPTATATATATPGLPGSDRSGGCRALGGACAPAPPAPGRRAGRAPSSLQTAAVRASLLPRHGARGWGLISIIISHTSSEKAGSSRRPPGMLQQAGGPPPDHPRCPGGSLIFKSFRETVGVGGSWETPGTSLLPLRGVEGEREGGERPRRECRPGSETEQRRETEAAQRRGSSPGRFSLRPHSAPKGWVLC